MRKEKYITEKESKRKGKYFEVVIKFEENGKRTSKSYGQFYISDYPSRKDALKQAVKARNAAMEDLEYNRITSKGMTVQECFEAAVEMLIDSRKNEDRHRASYRKIIKYTPSLAYKQIGKITTEDVLLNLKEVADHHSSGVVQDVKTVWHQIFQAAQLKEIPVIDRTMMIKNPKSKVPTERRISSCTVEDLIIILDNLLTYNFGNKMSIDLWYILQIMYYTGIRPQEALALCHKSVNLEKGEIYIFQSIGSTKTEYRQVIPTKTEDSIRPIPIAEGLQPLLEELGKRDTDLFFLDKDGKPYEVAVLGTMLLNMRKKRKLPRVTMYMCRHLFATDIYSKATNKKAAQTLMGHKSESMTLHYVYDDEDEKQDLVLNRKLS